MKKTSRTRAAIYADMNTRAAAGRRDGETVEAAFARLCMSDPDMIRLYGEYHVAPAATVSKPSRESRVATFEAMQRRADTNRKPGEQSATAFARLCSTDPEMQRLYAAYRG